jgi:hypothetical protein
MEGTRLCLDLYDARIALRNIAVCADTLSPQEFINVCADALGVDRHQYAGECDPNRSIYELRGALRQREAEVAALVTAVKLSPYLTLRCEHPDDDDCDCPCCKAADAIERVSTASGAERAAEHDARVRRAALEAGAAELERAFGEAETLNLLHGAARLRAMANEI